jgi:hypothetical protein
MLEVGEVGCGGSIERVHLQNHWNEESRGLRSCIY